MHVVWRNTDIGALPSGWTSMARIHAGFSELKASHLYLAAAAKSGEGAPAHLLLFYAAECGLKYAHLRRNNFRTTEQLEAVDHDLGLLLKKLNLSASAIGGAPTLRLARDERESCYHRARTRRGATACAFRPETRPNLFPGLEESVTLSCRSICDPVRCPPFYVAGC